MKPSPHNAGSTSRIRSRLFKPAMAVVLAGGLVAAVAAGAVAGNAGGGWHHGGAHAMAGNPQDVASHVDEMLQHIYTKVDATDAQKAQLGPIVQQAATDITQLHGELHSGHAQMMTLLTQDTVDRTELEAARAAQMQVADEASRRIVQLLADAADVLTPAQRKALAEHMAEHMAAHAH
jgi:Spy/CpxP family protein refolding chaperone